MTNVNATNFRKNMFEYLSSAILHNNVVNVNTKDGNAIVLSEEDYTGIIETLNLLSNKRTADEIFASMAEPIDEGEEYNKDEEW